MHGDNSNHRTTLASFAALARLDPPCVADDPDRGYGGVLRHLPSGSGWRRHRARRLYLPSVAWSPHQRPVVHFYRSAAGRYGLRPLWLPGDLDPVERALWRPRIRNIRAHGA